MPIHCPIVFPRLTEAEMRALDYEVMRHAFATHKALGCLCDESVYQAQLSHLLVAGGIPVEREVPVTLTFRTFLKPLYLDLVVGQRVIYELKTVASLTDAHATQLLRRSAGNVSTSSKKRRPCGLRRFKAGLKQGINKSCGGSWLRVRSRNCSGSISPDTKSVFTASHYDIHDFGQEDWGQKDSLPIFLSIIFLSK